MSRKEALNFLSNTDDGKELLKTVSESAAPGTKRKVVLDRAIDYIQTGKGVPELQKIETPLVKIVPKGKGVSEYSPFFTTMDELKAAQSTGRPLSDVFGLPAISDSASYDVFQIKPLGKATAFKSKIAPTKELGGKFITNGGADQIIVTNRNQFSAPERLFSIKDNVR